MEEQPKQKVIDEKIIQDFKKWAKQFPNPEKELFCYDNEYYTVQQLLDALRLKSKLGRDFLETYRSLSKKLGMEVIALIQLTRSDN